MAKVQEYDASSFRVLEGLEPVRKRVGMYLGDNNSRGFHHMFTEIFDNSVDEHLAGFTTKITAVLHADGSASVQDDGRGIPVDNHPVKKIPAATLAMTTLHAGGKFEGGAYKTSGGLHGVGASVVNALSSKFEMVITRDGYQWEQTFINGGVPVAPLARGKAAKGHGTYIRFWPDLKYFEEVGGFDTSIIRERLKLASYLNPGLVIVFKSELDNTEETLKADKFSDILNFLSDRTLQRVSEGTKDDPAIATMDISAHKTVTTDKGDVEVFLALRWLDIEDFNIVTFANNIKTPLGGKHEEGFRGALLRAINNYGTSNNMLKEPLTAEDIREGLVAAISVRLGEPKFEAQTKERLANTEALTATSAATTAAMQTFFEENPAQAKIIVNRAILSAKGREAAKRAKESVVKRKSVLESTSMPGKLADCREKNPANSELFIVEGDSAGGTAKTGRNSHNQAILPLRGKILNVLKADVSRALKSEQVSNLVKALGCGVSKHFDESRLRYHKVVMMTDADVDGAHIATLLLTFFHIFMPGLIQGGYVYTAMPPLYRVQKGKESSYIANDEALAEFFKGKDRAGWQINRFKGLGEMNADQLWSTTLDPEQRVLGRIVYANGGSTEAQPVFEVLMGEEVAPRRAFIEAQAQFATLDL